MRSIHHELGADDPEDELLELVAELNATPTVDGILVQLPLPEQIDQDAVIARDRPGQGRRRAHRRRAPACSPRAARASSRARRRA